MWWHGRENSCGSWLPEDKKANNGHGRGKSGSSWPPDFPALETELWLANELYSSMENFTVCVLACIISHGPNLGIV